MHEVKNSTFLTILPVLDEGVVRTEFYRLIELGVGEAANDLVEAFMAKVVEDGISDIIDRVIGVVSVKPLTTNELIGFSFDYFTYFMCLLL